MNISSKSSLAWARRTGRNAVPHQMTTRGIAVGAAAAIGLATVSVGCGESTADAHATDAGVEASEAGPVDPHCQDGMQLKERPKGACVLGASCAVLVEPQICADGKWPPGASPRQWFCECAAGAWECTNNGGLAIFLCEAGAPVDANGGAADGATDADASGGPLDAGGDG